MVGAKRRAIIPKNIGYSDFGLGPLPVDPFRRRKLGSLLDLLDKDQVPPMYLVYVWVGEYFLTDRVVIVCMYLCMYVCTPNLHDLQEEYNHFFIAE